MVRLTPLGAEFESVIAAVILFLAGGVMSFMCCFAVTHVYLCYKRRLTRKRRRHERNESRDQSSYAILEDDYYPQEVLVKKAKRPVNIQHSESVKKKQGESDKMRRSNTIGGVGNENEKKERVKNGVEIQSSSSTESTNTT
jgi:hypothetical protein